MPPKREPAAPPAPERTLRAPLVSNVDHLSAQAELDQLLFPHYLLGRQLAMEQVLRELLQAVPHEARALIAERLQLETDIAMDRLQDGIADPKDEVSTAGYIATLIQQGL